DISAEREMLRVVQIGRTEKAQAVPSLVLSTLPTRLSSQLTTAAASGGTTTVLVQGGGAGGGITGVDVRKNSGAVVGTRPQLNF
ncbi:hypothetical protein, partial [Streptococcus pneumoniae]|uniref:hypothetical protein n=1 Tax=Streptococcus pneumoniae TaxID=1313 RepID=UPI0018B0725A